LLLSGCTEAVWNICLTKSKGITDWPVNLIGVTFLAIGIVTFKKALDTTSLSVASVIWSGVSLILTILADVYFFKTRLDYRTAFFMVLCLLSTMGLNYYSNKA
jgi:multidrug transporter EmrE-like cation transporter